MTTVYESIECCIYIVGMIFTLKMLFDCILSFYKHNIRSEANLLERYGKNSWILVTGATAGIGLQMCKL